MRPNWIVLAAALLLVDPARAQGTAPAPLDLRLPPAYAPGCAAAAASVPAACGQPPLALTRPQAGPPETAAGPGRSLGRPWLQELIRGTVCTMANARYCAARDIPDYSTVRRVPDTHEAG